VRLEGSVYYYNLRNCVYTAFTGATDPGSHLPIVDYAQANSRFVGTEASLEAKVATTLWLNAKVDYVRAELTELNEPLPRIPPLRGTLGLDWRYKAFSVRPEMIVVNRQSRVFDNETPTAGYDLFNLNASYTFVTKQVAHILSLSGQNLTDKLYRNHLSFIKAIAPEMGRSVRINYALRF
jgi:iron complex outermembrane receptor protein